MNWDLNHDIYDSLVNTGKINFLTYEIQQGIQDIFKRIKRHNSYVYLVRDMIGKQKESKKYRLYLDWIAATEDKLIHDIPLVMEKLKNDFNVKSIS